MNGTEEMDFGAYTPRSTRPMNDGSQWLFRFDNGYGASVVQGPYTYGGPAGLYELGVVEWDGEDYGLTYSTPVTDDVVGYLSAAEVADLLRKIEELAPATPKGADL